MKIRGGHLNRAALPATANRIFDLQVNLGTIESTTSLIDLIIPPAHRIRFQQCQVEQQALVMQYLSNTFSGLVQAPESNVPNRRCCSLIQYLVKP